MTWNELEENGFLRGREFATTEIANNNQQLSNLDFAVRNEPDYFAPHVESAYTAAERFMFLAHPELEGDRVGAADAWTAILGDHDFGGEPPDAFVRDFVEGILAEWG